MSETATEIAAVGEGLASEATSAAEASTDNPNLSEENRESVENTVASSAEESAAESAGLTVDQMRAQLEADAAIFEQGPDTEGYEEAAARLDFAGWLEPIDAEEGEEGDDEEPISFDPDDYDSPELAKIAELEARLNAKDEAERTAAEEAARQQAIQMFAADMKEATGEDIDVENPDKWTPEQNILGSLGIQLGSVAKAKEMLAERDGQIKKEAIAKYIDGKSDVVLPPETSRTATENKTTNKSTRAEIIDASQRIIHGQQ